MISTVVLLLCLTSLVIQNEALSCTPCFPAKVKAEKCKDIDLTVCKAGTAKDMCGCCDVCAKAEGDTCGGIWNHGGTCSEGLNCHPNPDPARNQDPGSCSTKPLPPGYKPQFFK